MFTERSGLNRLSLDRQTQGLSRELLFGTWKGEHHSAMAITASAASWKDAEHGRSFRMLLYLGE